MVSEETKSKLHAAVEKYIDRLQREVTDEEIETVTDIHLPAVIFSTIRERHAGFLEWMADRCVEKWLRDEKWIVPSPSAEVRAMLNNDLRMLSKDVDRISDAKFRVMAKVVGLADKKHKPRAIAQAVGLTPDQVSAILKDAKAKRMALTRQIDTLSKRLALLGGRDY